MKRLPKLSASYIHVTRDPGQNDEELRKSVAALRFGCWCFVALGCLSRSVDIIQASEAEWDPAYDFVPICTLPVRPSVLIDKYGICFNEKRDGLGKLTYAFLRLGGKLVFLAAYPDGPGQAQLVHVRVQGNEPAPEEIMGLVKNAFGMADEDLVWKSPLLASSRWVLYRVDDNGNEVEMDRFLVRCIAENVAARFQAKGHKQTYLVREVI